MIIFNDQLLFVHNPKTAGTSLIEYFRCVLREPVFSAGVDELGTFHPHLSLSLGYACAKTGNRPEDFKCIFSVLRNPYDREISMFTYYRDVLANSKSLARDLNDPSMEEAVRQSAALPFADYLRWLSRTRGTCDVWRSRHYYTLEDGTVPENLWVVRLEEIDARIGEVSDILAHDENIPIPRLNRTEHPSSGVFDKETESIVFESYRWIFDAGFYPRLKR